MDLEKTHKLRVNPMTWIRDKFRNLNDKSTIFCKSQL